MCPLPPPQKKKQTNTGICCPGELPESYNTPRVVAHPSSAIARANSNYERVMLQR